MIKFSTVNMENQQELQQLDPQNMLAHIDTLPDQLLNAWDLGQTLPLPDFGTVKNIIVAGMGGSAIGGDLLSAYMRPLADIPVFSHRDYGLPAWARGRETLVICSSHSGNTEETLSSFNKALENGCSVLTLSTGGKLSEIAQKVGAPAWRFNHQGQPRTAVGFSFGILLALVSRLGMIETTQAEILETVNAMKAQQEKIGFSIALHANPARRLAGQLVGRYVSIMAAGENEVVARRWKTQIAELAKAWAQFEALPEVDHNTLAGLQNPEEAVTKVATVFLRSKYDHPRNQLRLDFTKQQCMQAGMPVDEVHASGNSRLAQMWTLLHFGDYVSYYLALHYQVDPTPIEALVALKQFLAGH